MRKLDEIKRGLGGKSKLSRLQASRLKGGAGVPPPPPGSIDRGLDSALNTAATVSPSAINPPMTGGFG